VNVVTMTSNPRVARSRLWLEIALGALTAVGPMSIDMYLPAIPSIAKELGVTHERAQLSFSAFFIGYAAGQFLSGPLTDRFGRKRPLVLALVAYAIASLGCALASNLEVLLVFRALAGLTGAAAVVVPRAVVRDLASGAEAARMLSRLLLVMGIAPIAAPLLGGALLAVASWRAIFVVLTVLAAFGAVVAHRMVPAGEPRKGSWLGALRAVAVDASFVRFALAGAAAQAGMMVYIAGSSFVFIGLHHVSPGTFGFYFGANAAGLILAAQLNRVALARRGPLQLAKAGTLALLLAGAAVLAASLAPAPALFPIALSFFAFLTSVGFVTPNTIALSLEAHAARAGVASAVMGCSQFAVAALATNIMSSHADGTARPLGVTMVALALAAFAFVRLGAPRAEDVR